MNKDAGLLLFSIFVLTLSSFAQKDEIPTRKGQLGISWSGFGSNDVYRSQELIGGASYHGDQFYTLGINYLYPLNKTFDIETGVEYSNHKIIITPMVYPGMDYPPHREKFSLISIPASVRVNFARYFFISGGIFLDIDASNSMPIDSQTGMGANLGIGVKYKFKCGVTAFVNPYTKAHSLLAFSPGTYQQHLMESGFRFGLMYQLN
jgi:hypothetical protein